MTKSDYNIVGSDGLIKNWFLSPLQVYDSTGALKLVREGDFTITSPIGTAVPVMRFDSIPFGGWISGSNMVFQYGTSSKLLTTSPKVVCLGSSTMAGFNLSSPNRLEDRLNAWLSANTTSPTLVNLAVAGYTMTNLRTVANGGTAGQNIEAAVAQNPTFIYVDEPTNWAASYDEATQISYMLEIFTYAFQRGILVIFGGSRPRTPYSGTQDTRLVNLNTLLQQHRTLKFVSVVNFSLFLQPSTVADLRSDYDQGDGIHLNATGVQALSASIVSFWQKALFAVTAYNQYVIEKSTDSGTTWGAFQTLTDMTLNRQTYTAATGLYRARARLKDNTTFTDNSATVSITAPGSITAKFNFNATAQNTANWTDVSGNPFAAGFDSAAYPGTTIFIRIKQTNASAVNIWGNTAGDSSNNNIGAVPSPVDSGAFPNTIIVSGMFTTGQSYAAGNEQIEIRGGTPGSSCNINAIGSRIASAVATTNRFMEWRCVDANGTTAITNYDVKGNTSTLATFSNRVFDANGVIKIAINRPTPTDANYNFGYIMGMTVQLL